MTTYSSNEEFFQAIRSLMDRMRQSGHSEAAEEIRSGFVALNGLTDGWAMLLESIEKVLAVHGRKLPTDQSSELKDMHIAVRTAVYR